MVVSVQAPFPIFCDANGTPIDGGYVYCGTENLNPITPANRIAVFSDAALSIALDNPVRTSGGYPIDASGNPVNIYAAGQFSIAIADRNNVVRVTSPSYGFRVLSDAITFDTVTIATSIIPDAAGGATNGTNAKPWTRVTSRDVHMKKATIFDSAQPTVADDLATLNQRKSICFLAKLTAIVGPSVTNGYNAGGIVTRTGPGEYTIVPTIALPATRFNFGSCDSNDPNVSIIVTSTTTLVTVRVYIGAALTDGSLVNIMILGNPAVTDPIS
jgi:hypothetical protein